MKNTRISIMLSCAMALTTAAFSQTWVSNAGSDSNPCTLAAPCRTFQRAVNVTPAWGQVGVLNAGDYGSVTITQAIRIDGGGLVSNVTTSGSSITVNTPAGNVVQLRNLSLHGNGATNGIYAPTTSSGPLDIDHVQVTGFGGNCITLDAGSDVVIKDSTVENCSGSGILVGTTTGKIINTHVRFANTGLSINGGNFSAFNSTFSSPGNPSPGTVGISVVNSNVFLDNCQIIGFYSGIYNFSSNTQVNRSSFFNNTTALANVFDDGAIFSNGNNSFFDNAVNGSFTATVALQ